MGVVDGIIKIATTSAIAGFTAKYILNKTIPKLPTFATISLSLLASCGGFTFATRVWIQGYYFDNKYLPKNSIGDLHGKTAVVTGGTIGGIGFAAAEILSSLGANVIITCRSQSKGDSAVKTLTNKLRKNSNTVGSDCPTISFVVIDFLSEESILAGAKKIETLCKQINFLILNAGISRSPNGKVSEVWMTNHVGPFIFTEALRPLLLEGAKKIPNNNNGNVSVGGGCRIVSVSSGAHKTAQIHWDDPFHPPSIKGIELGAYGQSKLANIMHMRELQKRLLSSSSNSNNDDELDVRCIPVTPGAVRTNIFKAPTLIYPMFWAITRSPTMGAQVIKMACLDADLKGGEYLSNCYVKPSAGFNNCSNDEAQWRKLWELTERHVKEKAFEKQKATKAD